MALFRRRVVVPHVPASPLEFEYEMVALRQMEQDAMLWQTPSIVLTAQAFLLTIALSPASSASGRIISGLLGVLVAVLSMQLMATHRKLAGIDRVRMVELEALLGMGPVAERGWSPRKSKRHGSTFSLWMFGLTTFIAADIVAVGFAVVKVVARIDL